MSSQTRDTLALYAIAALAVLLTLYADSGADLGHVFHAILARL
jgi:hypothetical protein